jgi:hypothetical protein
MALLEHSPPYYWAPEVFYENGKFYLYYSVGNEIFMQLRVAVSERPDGGFADSGHRLTNQDFAIDAHVFVDDNGVKYLFYATDFLEHTHIGTGTVVDRMVDWFTLEGNPHPVTRAKFDWQVYDPNRKEKGGVRWHTVEGPAVLKRKGLYYEMFSGGNWQNTTYGVSFAVSSQIENPEEWTQFSDGENVLPILRTMPEVVGPGHNSIVRGPNNRELYCVYHRWTDAGRVMAVDRMDFAGDRLFLVGATNTPQPAPFLPNSDIKSGAFDGAIKTGEWIVKGRSAQSGTHGKCDVEFASLPESFLCELTLRCRGPLSDNGSVEVRVPAGDDCVKLKFLPISNVVRMEFPEDSTGLTSISRLPESFDWTEHHLLRIETDFHHLKLRLDETAMPRVNACLTAPPRSLAISSENQSIEISSFELTGGFESLFEGPIDIAENGWELVGDVGYRVEAGELTLEAPTDFRARKHWPTASMEFAANVRVLDDAKSGEFGLLLENGDSETIRLSIDRSTFSLRVNRASIRPLPASMALEKYHQLRILKTRSRILCYLDDALVHELPCVDPSTHCSVFSKGAQLGVEMIRITTI